MANYGYKNLTDALSAAEEALEFSSTIYRDWQGLLREVRAHLPVLNTRPDRLRQHLPTTEEYRASLFEWRRVMELEEICEAYVQDSLRKIRCHQAEYNSFMRDMGLEVPSHDPWAGGEQKNMRSGLQVADNWTGTPAQERLLSNWKHVADKALQDRATMRVFPDPPASYCGKERCSLQRVQRALDACECVIEAALKLDPEYTESLKAARVQWHPDKFQVCPEEYVELFKKKAAEIFIVANSLIEEGKE
jgi:hypothetical protein